MLDDGDCNTSNLVDNCWRCDPRWVDNRQRLADCAIGFDRDVGASKNDRSYVVTDPGDADDLTPGTLYYGLTEDKPLWIMFARDMTVRPIHDLLVHFHMHKTVDGRGVAVVVGYGGGFLTIHNVHHPHNHGVRLQARAGGERRLVGR
jgi:pectate lyase